MNTDDANRSIQRQIANCLTIDATGPSPEINDECINRHAQDIHRLIALWPQQGRFKTTGWRQLFDTPEVQNANRSITRRCEELYRQHLDCLQKLSDVGWFFSPDTPIEQLRDLANSLGTNTCFANGVIRSYFQVRINSIERELSEAYPRRSQIFHDAFEAHKSGRYTLSVPVFLTQADGVWRDQFGRNFFERNKRKSTLQDCNNDLQLQYIATMLTLLEPREEGMNNPLWANEAERDTSFGALNRHQVLHGESVDYATEENSLKAISLLVCFRGICRRVAQ